MPLAFENVKCYAAVRGGDFASYQLRNMGRKPVRPLVVATSAGTGIEWLAENTPVLPGQMVPLPDGKNTKIVPWTDDIRLDLDPKGPMTSFVILMVVKVECTDGTVYEDEVAHDALTGVVDKLDDAVHRQEQLLKKKLRHWEISDARPKSTSNLIHQSDKPLK